MKITFEPPAFQKKGFTCPNCSTYSKHDWTYQSVNETHGGFFGRQLPNSTEKIKTLYLCKCQHCGYISFWYDGNLVWPLNTNVESPVEEMPGKVKELYNEARGIIQLSPKGSCAILRLALQILCNDLAGKKENGKVDVAISELVKKGLPSSLQKAMDIVRVIGNEAVHPGEINIDDNIEIAYALFRLINIIVEKMIVEPNVINDLYQLLPEAKLKGIEIRDKKNDEKK